MKLTLGTAQFGLDYGISNKRGKIPKKEVFDILKFSIKNGINTIDTAYAYGDSENIIGEFIKKNNSDFKIVSKLPAGNKENVEIFFKESLKRLNSNNIYGYLIHDFESFSKEPSIWGKLKEIKNTGKVKKIGFSLYYPKEVEYILDKNLDVDIVQFPFNIFDQRFDKIMPLLKKRGIEIHTRSVFLQGLVFKDPNKLNKNFVGIQPKISFLRKLSKKIRLPISAICINFALLNEHIDKVIMGVDSIENLKENINALKHQEKIKGIYSELLNLKEDNENIILPVNWAKEAKI